MEQHGLRHDRRVCPHPEGAGIWQVRWSIFPRWKGSLVGAFRSRSEPHAKGTSRVATARPTFPKMNGPDAWRGGFGRVTDPKQFEVAIAEEESAALGALSRMRVGGAFAETKRRQGAALLVAAR